MCACNTRGRVNMFTSLLGASIGAADIIVFVLLGLGLVLGAIGGLQRAFKGIFAAVTIILVALLLTGVTVDPISRSSMGTSLNGSLKGSAEGWGVVFTSPIYIAEADGQPITDDSGNFTYCIEVDGKMVSLEDAEGSKLVAKTKAKIAERLARRFVTQENSGKVTLAGYAADALTTLIFDIVLFVVYCIALGLLFFLLRKLFGLMHRSDNIALRVTDRILGAVVATGLALITVLFIFAIIKSATPEGSKVAQFFENTPVAGALYNAQLLSPLLAKIFG